MKKFLLFLLCILNIFPLLAQSEFSILNAKDIQKKIKENRKQFEQNISKDTLKAVPFLIALDENYADLLKTQLNPAAKIKLLSIYLETEIALFHLKLNYANLLETIDAEKILKAAQNNYLQLTQLEDKKPNLSKKILELIKTKRDEYFTKAVLFLQNTSPNYIEAVQYFQAASAILSISQNNDPESAFWQGFSLLQMGENKYDESLSSFMMALEGGFRKEDAYLVCVQILNRKLAEQKMELASKVVKNTDSKQKILLQDTPISTQLTQLIDRAISDYPENTDFLNVKIEFLIQTNQLEEALKMGLSTLSKDTNNFRLYYNIGLIYTEIANQLLNKDITIKDTKLAKKNQVEYIAQYKLAIQYFEKSAESPELKTPSAENLQRLKTLVENFEKTQVVNKKNK